MTLEEKINSINQTKLTRLPNGEAHSLDEFWDKVVKDFLPDDETIIGWHNLLISYVNRNHPMIAIRGYNSASKGHYDKLRRGFLTESDSFDYFFTDNFYAAYICKMVLDGFVPTLDEFEEMMTTRKFPSRFGSITKEEKELMAIKQGKDPYINYAGYKIAHIIPVGKDFLIDNEVINNQKILSKFFPRGERTDWQDSNVSSVDNYKRRYLKSSIDAKKVAIAIFLRFTDPLNYILTPKQTCEKNDMSNGLGIGEYDELLNKAHNYYCGKYHKEYNEFLSYIMFPISSYDMPISYNNKLNIEYGIGINPKNSGTKSKSSSKVKVKSKTAEEWKIYRASLTSGSTIGKFAIHNFLRILNDGKFTKEDLEDCLDCGRSFDLFGLYMPALVEINSQYDKARYYKPDGRYKVLINYDGKQYLLCSQWIDENIDKLVA